MLSGKRILITGANGGIGYAISELLLKNNAKIDLIYHKNKQNLERLIRDNPGKLQDISIHQADLTKDEELEDVLTTITGTKQVDIFIHSPTYPTPHKSIMSMEWSEFQNHIELQSKAFFQKVNFVERGFTDRSFLDIPIHQKIDTYFKSTLLDFIKNKDIKNVMNLLYDREDVNKINWVGISKFLDGLKSTKEPNEEPKKGDELRKSEPTAPAGGKRSSRRKSKKSKKSKKPKKKSLKRRRRTPKK